MWRNNEALCWAGDIRNFSRGGFRFFDDATLFVGKVLTG